MPAPYEIPKKGPTGDLMHRLGRHSWRPAHFLVTADGFGPLVTQLYFRGDPYLDSDAVNAVKDQLIVDLTDTTTDSGGDAASAAFTFVLEPAAGRDRS